MTIIAFFLLRADLIPCVFTVYAVLVAFQVAAEEAAVTIALQCLSARLAAYSVVVALPFEMLAVAHMRSDYIRRE